ncbi:hypothetical protein BCR43DRAFT_44110 [Syncephalastrum racemosum]|uniref:FAD dependent oxidoreductase domain-containing protein n=1 Tax=Syncephalastrum racemosum TaxID=13706 RepID=A0A1X2HUU5_SYNRA|nr:hypothetical protein BCR43DRAFT_44110 [Syncephalastrum racemosum]
MSPPALYMVYILSVPTPTIHVIGAGVIGLSTAVWLLARGYKNVILIATDLPGDPPTIEYTSPWAGARWQSSATKEDLTGQRHDRDTFAMLWKLLAAYPGAQTGIIAIPAHDIYRDPTPDEKAPWFKDFVPGFRHMEQGEIPANMDYGLQYTTLAVNPLVYLPWLFSRYLAMGGTYRRATVQSLIEDDAADCVINCTGFHAREVASDPTVVPTRGQNVVVFAPHVKRTVSYKGPGLYAYVIPRSDGTVILGSTVEPEKKDPTVDPVAAKEVLERACNEMCPELKLDGKLPKVVGHVVGMRPVRKGGPRLENEFAATHTGKRVLITHNYGHGGQGYMASWGSAIHAVDLMESGYLTLAQEGAYAQNVFSRL